MFNGAAFNSRTMNGTAAGALLVLATASFSATATVTQTPTLAQAALGSWDAVVDAIFGPDKTQFGSANLTATAVITASPTMDWGGSGDWTAEATFLPVTYRIIPGDFEWNATADLQAIADSLIGSASWSADATTDFTGHKIGALEGDFESCTAVWSTVDSDITFDKGVTGNWSASAEIFVGGDITYNGDSFLTHFGYGFWDADADWSVDTNLTATFVNGAFYSPGATVDFGPYVIHGATASWTATATVETDPNRVAYSTLAESVSATFEANQTLTQDGGDMTMAGTAVFTGAGTRVVQGATNWTAGATIEATPDHTQAGIWETEVGADVTIDGYISKSAEGELDVSATVEFTPDKTAWATAAWSGLASSVSAAAIVSLVAAPKDRVFKVSETARTFYVSSVGPRTFKVSAS